MYTKQEIADLELEWNTRPRWKGIQRYYTAEDVVKLRGSVRIESTLAKLGSEKLWNLLQNEPFIRTLGALTGNQAVQIVQAGLQAIYASGWQVAADANDALQTYPDLSLYPHLSMPRLIQRINHALLRADQIQHMNNASGIDWMAPILADAEAGFGGGLNTYELTRAMIEAGVAGIHLEDQLASQKKCGHMGAKVLISQRGFIEKLQAARLAADIKGVPLVIVARTDAHSAKFIGPDYDPLDAPFLTGRKSPEGYHFVKGGIPYAIQRGLEFAPHADMVWCETATPDLGEAREFASGIHEKYPGKWLAYNCSPSFNWKKHLDERTLARFQEQLAEMGYKFQFVTLAGFHTLNASMFRLAHEYRTQGMEAYARFQESEFEMEEAYGYNAARHQQFVGTGYFDALNSAINRGSSSTSALEGSTEALQFPLSKHDSGHR